MNIDYQKIIKNTWKRIMGQKKLWVRKLSTISYNIIRIDPGCFAGIAKVKRCIY